MYSTRTSCVKPRFRMFRLREKMRNVRLHARHYHPCYAFSTKRWVFDTKTVIIQGKISIIPPQVPPSSRGKTPEAPSLWGILWRDNDNCVDYLCDYRKDVGQIIGIKQSAGG
ncbi:hypothetical protein E2C01_064182 [Portunus trituberculatus]|uniref:Uncharacterized protein n=1 Tax=Portunus trituberculatus TaxID=210409 RepID=A0A5B7HCD8_PORTR|nr:hypothetical protein [Portunus trituberculatus]